MSMLANQDILSVDQFTPAILDLVFETAEEMRDLVESRGGDDRLKYKISTNLFYEPSTRTSSSFAAAMYRLGGKVVSINDVHYSSVSKGETLEDTVRTLEQYTDLIVLRHPEKGSAALAAKATKVPLINAGDGVGEHPTQALLDLYTIINEIGAMKGAVITLVGDLKYGRTVHSLARLLNHYPVTFQFVSPDSLRMPDDIKVAVMNKYTETSDFETALGRSDLVYMTRVQKERFNSVADYEAVRDLFLLDKALLKKAKLKKSAPIMHPLPRVNELSSDIDSDPRAAYFRQMRNGLYIRMALLWLVLGEGA